MICTVAEFTTLWQREMGFTAKALRALTDASLAQRVTAEDRSLGELAWHLATTIPEMMGRTGLALDEGDAEAPTPASAAAIAAAYERASQGLHAAVTSSWRDETLTVEDEMYGERWPRSFTLTALILHEIHHRGQMTVLMRQAGLVVPSLYGPNREETAAMMG